MAVTYELIIVGTTSAEDFIARVYDGDPPAFEPSNQAVVADETERFGFWLTLLEGSNGYFQDDDWEIEPARYLKAEFRVDQAADPETVRANVRRFVDRALATGDEDMALLNNSFTLMFERRNGELRWIRPL